MNSTCYKFLFLYFILILVVSTSCTMKKRLYRPGFYIAHVKDRHEKDSGHLPEHEKENTEPVLPADAVFETQNTPVTTNEKVPAVCTVKNADYTYAENETTGKVSGTPADLISVHRIAVSDTTAPANTAKKQPVHPKVKSSFVIRVLFHATLIIVGLLLLILPPVSLEAAILLFLAGIAFGGAYVVAIILNIIGLVKLRKQELPVHRGKKLAFAMLMLDTVYLLAGIFIAFTWLQALLLIGILAGIALLIIGMVLLVRHIKAQ